MTTDRPVNDRRRNPINRAVVLNELNAEVDETRANLTLTDLQQYGVDRDASLKLPAHVIQFTDGSRIEFNSSLGWWMPIEKA